MTRRDMAWRAVGVVIGVGACGAAVVADGSALAMLLFPVALIGLTLIVNGKRVAIALRAERLGHAHTAQAIHAVRLRRGRQRLDEPHR